MHHFFMLTALPPIICPSGIVASGLASSGINYGCLLYFIRVDAVRIATSLIVSVSVMFTYTTYIYYECLCGALGN